MKNLNQLSKADSAIKHILQKYSSMFDGLGKSKGEIIALSIDESQGLKCQKHQRSGVFRII